MLIFSAFIALVVSGICGLRWLRVAQREHYIAGSVSHFASRWWGLGGNWDDMGANRGLFIIALIGLFGTLAFKMLYLVSFVVVTVGPLGLGIKGTSSKLNWTRRLKTLALVWFVIQLVLVMLIVVLPNSRWSFFFLDVVVIATPLVVDIALWITSPIERVVSKKYVQSAELKLKSISPAIVAITGSFGKTTTKGYLAHLISTTKQVLATPRSFNTTAGLARSINNQLSSDIEVFIAEMGTYGRGEIAQLCSWVPPAIGVITAIGPVHLERFGSEDKIVKAKSEILEKATVAVLNVDDDRLLAVADQARSKGKKVLTCSALDEGAFVCVKKAQDNLDVYIQGQKITTFSLPSAAPGNVACAIAVAIELGVGISVIVKALPTLPVAPNRLTFSTSDRGFSIIDDTYNSNPSGCKVALFVLANTFKDAPRKVVVTPGMIELGSRQEKDNELFAKQAVLVADDFIVVGKTNKKALLKGVKAASVEPTSKQSTIKVVKDRAEAVSWVREQLGPTDVVLYENDLPDHFA